MKMKDDDLQAFRRDGFVVLGSVLSKSAVDRLARIIDLHRTSDPAAETGYGTVDSEVSRDYFEKSQDLPIWLADNGLPPAASALLGATGARPVRDRLFIKAPGTDERSMWHQDEPLTKEAAAAIVVLWIPLTQGAVNAAPLQVAIGSHRTSQPVLETGLASWRAVTGPDTALVEVSDIERKYDVVTVKADVGDVVALDGLVLHASQTNNSPVERIAYSVRFAASTSAAERQAPDLATGEAGTEALASTL